MFKDKENQKKYFRLYYLANRAKLLKRGKKRYEDNLEEIREYHRKYNQRTDFIYLKQQMVRAARCRAKKFGIPFDLSFDDFEIPERCPALGIKLKKSRGRQGDCSPALDRIIPRKGYTKGNIQVISQRANVLKRDASLKELRELVRFLEKINN